MINQGIFVPAVLPLKTTDASEEYKGEKKKEIKRLF